MNEIDTRRQEVIQRQAGKPGLRGRINAKCCECICDPRCAGGSWKQQVSACTSMSCLLHPIRVRSEGEAA
jgi:hypothetical protein